MTKNKMSSKRKKTARTNGLLQMPSNKKVNMVLFDTFHANTVVKDGTTVWDLASLK